MPPRISIVTPNYNYAHFLEATLQSILNQNYPNLEYIVMDDGSSDGSVDLIRRYESQLSHWETGPNRGQYKVITAGFGKSTGEVMGWLNSDDLHLPWTLRAVGEIFQTFPEVEWISTLHPGNWDWAGFCTGFGSIAGFSRDAFADGRYLPIDGEDVLKQRVPRKTWSPIQQESTFWRRRLWEKAGGYVSHEFASAGDFELWARFFRHAELIGVAIPLAGFRHQHQQQTNQLARYARHCAPALQRLREDLSWKPDAVRSFVYSARRWRLSRFLGPLPRKVGYPAKRIVRKDAETPNGHWELEDYRFL